ncbi:unnamed protein product [Rhizophagus irregularis]|nr:unnamed protein product [Rhizophagus irregularis]
MNFYRNKHQKIKHNVRNNQAEDDEYPSQSSLNDYSDVYKQELTKCEKELSEITVKFNKMKENNYELEVKVQKLEDDLLQERKKNNFIIEKEKQELDSKLKILEENYQRYNNQLIDRYNELESAKQNMERDMENNIKNLEQQLRDQRIKFQQEFKQAHEKYKKNINNIRQKLDEKGNGLRDLEDKNARLKEEASKYQSALGVATNIFLSDGDLNHSVKLKNDILKLQTTLDNYVTHLKPNMNINIKKVQELAQEYGCLNEITANNPNKIFIKAILQRKVLDSICEFSHEFFKFQCGNSKLESDVESKATELLELIKLFLTTRAGTDEVTGASIIKIRQQVYGILVLQVRLMKKYMNNIITRDDNVFAQMTRSE